MTSRRLVAFVWASVFVGISGVVRGIFVSNEQKQTPGEDLEKVTWEAAQNGKLPSGGAYVAGYERTPGGRDSPIYVARALVPEFGSGMVPGYFSVYMKKAVITGVRKGPYFQSECEVLTSKPKWKTVAEDDDTIPLKAVPVGRYGAYEPVYSCRTEKDGLERIGVMWWGQKYCHVLVEATDDSNSFEYKSVGSYEYDMLVA